MASAQQLTARQGDTLDLLLWRDAGLGPDHLTRVLDANPGLADLGTILPLGALVTVPATSASTATGVRTITQLWD
ncbi:tail protein X [Sphingobium yanoikuyae]|uniref:tail protein X n=1 Tax=Sphingobium yanoikuyae TaxID=13690 RepID=UPI002FDAC792